MHGIYFEDSNLVEVPGEEGGALKPMEKLLHLKLTHSFVELAVRVQFEGVGTRVHFVYVIS